MKNFIFKSNDSDLQKMFQTIETIQKNVLYITHRVDRIIIDVNRMITDKSLQRQVDQYFEDDETSPQTDSQEQKSD